MQCLALLSLFVIHILCQVKAELFTSNAHLQTVLYAERDVASLLKNYIKQEEDRLEQIRKLADDFESHSTNALQDINTYLGNPINAFLLTKRFTLDWDRQVTPVISNSTWENMHQELEQARADLPTYEDLKGAASALMRLQDTYKLDTSTVAEGTLAGTKSPILSAEECFELGRLAYNNEDFYHTTLWMEQALETRKKNTVKIRGEDYGDGKSGDILDFLAFSYYKLGNVPQALDLTNELLRIDPHHERAGNNKKYFEAMMQDESSRQKFKTDDETTYQAVRDEYRNSDEFLRYEALCRGEETQPLKDSHKFTCRYVTNNHPLLILQPVKEETAHLDPWLVIYYDVLSDQEIEAIKRLATPRLNRATVQNAKTGALETANYRISKSAWLRSDDSEVVERYNQRMEAITGLDMNTAEELQIANYGLGGHYEPHFDYARREKKTFLQSRNGNRIATFLTYKEEKDAFKSLGTGNRIATFLTYMSDVEVGGGTVFPYIGLKLFPKKGAAAFWYNLHRNGDGIYNTRHAACPVLVGIKWVSNKWIHERGQEFRRSCGLDPDE